MIVRNAIDSIPVCELSAHRIVSVVVELDFGAIVTVCGSCGWLELQEEPLRRRHCKVLIEIEDFCEGFDLFFVVRGVGDEHPEVCVALDVYLKPFPIIFIQSIIRHLVICPYCVVASINRIEVPTYRGCDGLVHAKLDVGGRKSASVLFEGANRRFHLIEGNVPTAHG